MTGLRVTPDIEIRGTADADSIAAVLALLQRAHGGAEPPVAGVAAWRVRRRAALTRTARTPRR